MNPDCANFAQCKRHPSQYFTGFCSSCLAERLAGVNRVERIPKPLPDGQQKVAECPGVVTEEQRISGEIRVRRTLLSLFQLDDHFNADSTFQSCNPENSVDALKLTECQNVAQNGGKGFEVNSGIRASRDGSVSQSESGGDNRRRPEVNQVSAENGTAHVDENANSGVTEKRVSFEDDNIKHRNGSFWSSSTFPRKLLRWKLVSACAKSWKQGKNFHGRLGGKQSEQDQNFRHSCDEKVSCDSSKVHWEDPRHSWDGVMMGKAFTPSFTAIEEDQNSSMIYSRGSLPKDEMMVESRQSTDTKDMNKGSTTSSSDEKSFSVSGSTGEINGESHCVDTRQDIRIPKIRRQHHGWSKIWNKTLTSPLRDLLHKRENVLGRSLSESWREVHKEKNVESMGMDGRASFQGSKVSSSRKQHDINRSNNIGNGENKRFKPDSSKKEFLFGRSQSVHYSSPGNFESGLLRFYLTPLRSSRRVSRRRTSRSFVRDILGF